MITQDSPGWLLDLTATCWALVDRRRSSSRVCLLVPWLEFSIFFPSDSASSIEAHARSRPRRGGRTSDLPPFFFSILPDSGSRRGRPRERSRGVGPDGRRTGRQSARDSRVRVRAVAVAGRAVVWFTAKVSSAKSIHPPAWHCMPPGPGP